MNENYESLRNTLLGLGYGVDPSLFGRLEQAIALDEPEFTLYAEYRFDDQSKTVVKLYFSRSAHAQHHRLIMSDTRLYYPGEPLRNRTHTFLGDSISFKESFNLLQGRAVYKTFQSLWTGTSNVWIQLSFEQKDATGAYKVRQFGEQYGYSLEKILAKYPIAELDDLAKKAALLASLREGNLCAVTALKATKAERWLIAANPQLKAIHIYPGGKIHPPSVLDHRHRAHW